MVENNFDQLNINISSNYEIMGQVSSRDDEEDTTLTYSRLGLDPELDLSEVDVDEFINCNILGRPTNDFEETVPKQVFDASI